MYPTRKASQLESKRLPSASGSLCIERVQISATSELIYTMPSFNKSTTIIPSVKTANRSSPPSTVRLEGYLMKQKHGKCKAWQKRYFVLYGEELRYYKNKV
ncbi:hypothetical protein G6F42_019904 [Rhizopus arrhizus]|nr:hypothetical protein G6F42_019904 [Rhizopus arrhizus]